MSVLLSVICVALGGAPGALLRFAFCSRFDATRFGYPFGTFLVNMAASAALGIFTALSPHLGPHFELLAETGFCATLSTFSSLAFQIAVMLESRRAFAATLYATASLMFGMALFLAANHAADALFLTFR